MVPRPAGARQRLQPHDNVYIVHWRHASECNRHAVAPYYDTLLLTFDPALARRVVDALRARHAYEREHAHDHDDEIATGDSREFVRSMLCVDGGCSIKHERVNAAVFLHTGVEGWDAMLARGVDIERYYVDSVVGEPAYEPRRARAAAWLRAALPGDADRIAV